MSTPGDPVRKGSIRRSSSSRFTGVSGASISNLTSVSNASPSHQHAVEKEVIVVGKENFTESNPALSRPLSLRNLSSHPHTLLSTKNLSSRHLPTSTLNEGFEDNFKLSNIVTAYMNKDAFDGLLVPIFPECCLPFHLPLSRIRNIFFNITTRPGCSHTGNIYFLVNTLTIIMSITSFCLASLSEHRIRRLKKQFVQADYHLQYIDLACLCFFAFDYFGRLVCVTSEPFTTKEKDAMKLYERWRRMISKRFDQADAYLILRGEKSPLECTSLPHYTPEEDEVPLAEPYLPQAFRSTTIKNSGEIPVIKTILPSKHSLLRSVHVLVYYILEPTNIMDLISIIPFFLNSAIQSLDFMGLEERNGDPTSLLVLRIVRVSKIAPLLRFTGRLPVVRILFRSLYDASEALLMLFIFLTLGVILFGSMVFFAESGVWNDDLNTWMRPSIMGTSEEATPFRSIPSGMWWAVVTLATVGYGDLVPTTPWGKVIGGLAIACGLVMLAMPMTVIGSTFTNEYVRYKADLAAGGDGFSLDFDESDNVVGGPIVFAKGVTDSLASNIHMLEIRSEIAHLRKEFRAALGKIAIEMDEVLDNQIQEKELLEHGALSHHEDHLDHESSLKKAPSTSSLKKNASSNSLKKSASSNSLKRSTSSSSFPSSTNTLAAPKENTSTNIPQTS
jgi:hypothetical protein